MSGSKKNLTKALQEAMRAEEEKDGGQSHKACRSEECQCVRDGVECHADLCNCCKGPHVGKKDAHVSRSCANCLLSWHVQLLSWFCCALKEHRLLQLCPMYFDSFQTPVCSRRRRFLSVLRVQVPVILRFAPR